MNCQAVATKTSANPVESSGNGMVLHSCPQIWEQEASPLYLCMDQLCGQSALWRSVIWISICWRQFLERDATMRSQQSALLAVDRMNISVSKWESYSTYYISKFIWKSIFNSQILSTWSCMDTVTCFLEFNGAVKIWSWLDSYSFLDNLFCLPRHIFLLCSKFKTSTRVCQIWVPIH